MWCCWCLLASLSSCSMIDEDQSDCVRESEVKYELTLVTNITTEITTQLNDSTEKELGDELRKHLQHIFTDYAHDVDLSFYDTVDDSVRLHHDLHIMDANQASYTLNLPRRHYMHLAAANLMNNSLVSLINDGNCHPSKLHQVPRDTIESHNTGLYTARLPMNVLDNVDQDFKVNLYMANCAAVLVVDPRDVDPRGMEVYTTGFADEYLICDSSYVYPARSPIVRTEMVGKDNGHEPLAFCSVNFPSRPGSATRTVIETEEPFISKEGDENLWEFRVYVPQPETEQTRGRLRITETVLSLKKPLKAGQVIIIKGWLDPEGIFTTEDKNVGVSVTLDWNKNNEQDVPL